MVNIYNTRHGGMINFEVFGVGLTRFIPVVDHSRVATEVQLLGSAIVPRT